MTAGLSVLNNWSSSSPNSRRIWRRTWHGWHGRHGRRHAGHDV